MTETTENTPKSTQKTMFKLDTMKPRIFLQMSRYLGLKEMLQLARVSKSMRDIVARSLQPKLRKYYELKSYISKYPFKSTRAALNRKLLVLNMKEVDNLLLYGSRIKPKNVGINPDVELRKQSMLKPAPKPTVFQKGKQFAKKGGKKKGKGKRKKSFYDPVDEVVNLDAQIQEKTRNLRKKLVQVVPGLNINHVYMGKRLTAFSDGDTVFVLPLDKLSKLKKIKEVHCAQKIEKVVKF